MAKFSLVDLVEDDDAGSLSHCHDLLLGHFNITEPLFMLLLTNYCEKATKYFSRDSTVSM